MTTPPPDEPADGLTPQPPSLFDRLAEFEPEEDDLFDDEYDDAHAELSTDPSMDPTVPTFHPVDPVEGAPLATVEPEQPGVSSYDDSGFAAGTDEPDATEDATEDAPAAPDVAELSLEDELGFDPGPDPVEPAETAVPPAQDSAGDSADDHSLDDSAHDSADDSAPDTVHDTAVLDPFAAVPTPLAAVPVDAGPPAGPAGHPGQATESPAATEPTEPAEPAESGEPVLAPGQRRRRRSGRRLTLPVVALLLMTALMAAATAYLWLQVRDHDRAEAARKSGLAASRDAARLLFSYDYRTLDKDFQTGRALTTGEFRTQYDKTTTKVVADVAKQYKAVVKANVVGAGVVSATPKKIVTVVYVNQVTTSTRVTGEKVDLSRVRMTLERSGGSWLVTSVNAL